MILEPVIHDLGGFSVRRLLPSAGHRMVGPWVFFDHFGPATLSAGPGVDVRPHPHIGIATVTYLFEGEIFHRDSLGSAQAIRPGDINLMLAGSGIVHSERERPERMDQDRPIHGLQLWLALPEKDEELDPAFTHYREGDIPAAVRDGVALRVMMGSAFGLTSPVQTFADTLYVEAQLLPGQTLQVPQAAERAVYAASGDVLVNGELLQEYQMMVLPADTEIGLAPVDEARIAIIGGEALGPRHLEWNFVSSRRERIEQAKADWQAGRFPTVPGDEEEFIPLPD